MRCAFTFDDRERELRREFQAYVDRTRNDTVAAIQTRRLPLADVVIEPVDHCRTLLVERKRVDDLMGSIYDGRLTEQLRRLRAAAARSDAAVTTVLVVEGAWPTPRGPGDDDHRYRHFLKTCVQLADEARGGGGSPLLLRSAGLAETARYLLTLHRTIRRADQVPTALSMEQRSLSFPGRARVPPFVHQLCSTRGISERRARAVLCRFDNVAHLLDAWRRDPGSTEEVLRESLEGRLLVERLLADLGLDPGPQKRPLATTSTPTSSSRSRNRRPRWGEGPRERDHPVRDEDCGEELQHPPLYAAAVDVVQEKSGAPCGDQQGDDLACHLGMPDGFIVCGGEPAATLLVGGPQVEQM